MHQLFLSKIPKEKLHLGKKIESIEDSGEKVTIHCADGSSANGDVLVGADGAYSGVRTSLFKAMDEKSLLPEADKEELSVGHICMVGTTKPLEDSKYEALKDSFSHFERVLMQGTPHSVNLHMHQAFFFPAYQTFCYSVFAQSVYFAIHNIVVHGDCARQ